MKKPSHITKNYEALFEKARTGEASPRQAIKAMCQQCVGYQDTKTAIRECKSELCPLHTYRPYIKKPKNVPVDGFSVQDSTIDDQDVDEGDDE